MSNLLERIESVLIAAIHVAACRDGDIDTEDGSLSTTGVDEMIRLEQALCSALDIGLDDVNADLMIKQLKAALSEQEAVPEGFTVKFIKQVGCYEITAPNGMQSVLYHGDADGDLLAAMLSHPQPQKVDELTIADYEQAAADHRRLVRELDVLLNGEDGAEKQASLCDIVAQVHYEKLNPKVPQSAEEFIAEHEYPDIATWEDDDQTNGSVSVIKSEDVRDFMAGKALVPVEPTDEMIDAACDASNLYRVDFMRAWDAAINAAKGE